MAILIDVEKNKYDKHMNVSFILNLIKNFYDKVNANNLELILKLPFCCLIAGQDDDEKATLVSIVCTQGNLQYKEVPVSLFHPQDADISLCQNIFARNYKLNHHSFVEQTILDISKISKLVSPTGDKWIFDKKTQTGKMYSF